MVNITQMAGQWIGKQVCKVLRTTEEESEESSNGEGGRASLSLPVNRAGRDYSNPKYFERLMAGE